MGLLVRFITGYLIPYTSESSETFARAFVKKKVIILAGAFLMPVCGRGISGGHDGKAQTFAGERRQSKYKCLLNVR